MPGPGGGGRGGGGFGGGGGFRGGGFGGRGGFHGGGFHGGGFHHHRPFMGGWYHRPYYGGGCLGGLLGMFLGPIILIIMAAVMVFSYVGTAFTEVSQGGAVVYDEEVFQDYADSQYAAEFGSTAYEDNILLVFLTDETSSSYCYIAWVGDHIATDINYQFGNEYTELGDAMSACINTANYKYSLDSNLAQVVAQMQKNVTELGLESAFVCEERREADSHLTNRTDLSLTADTVNTALESFTQATGIPMVIVVDEMEDVFGKTVSKGSVVTLVIGALLLILAIYLIVKAVKRKNQNPDDRYDRQNDYDRY